MVVSTVANARIGSQSERRDVPRRRPTPVAATTRAPGNKAIALLDVAVANLTEREATGRIIGMLNGHELSRIAFFNAHAANLAASDPAYKEKLRRFLVLPDGIGVDLGAKLISGQAFKANLNGTDFVPLLLQRCRLPLKVALFGSAPGVADKACAVLMSTYPRHRFYVAAHGFTDDAGRDQMLRSLSFSRPDMLLVALGNPRQENFIADHLDSSHAKIAIGVGALFDFLAGEMPRAPLWIRRARIEWMFRLTLEPRRLFGRYVIGNPAFLFRIIRQKLRRGAAASQGASL